MKLFVFGTAEDSPLSQTVLPGATVVLSVVATNAVARIAPPAALAGAEALHKMGIVDFQIDTVALFCLDCLMSKGRTSMVLLCQPQRSASPRPGMLLPCCSPMALPAGSGEPQTG